MNRKRSVRLTFAILFLATSACKSGDTSSSNSPPPPNDNVDEAKAPTDGPKKDVAPAPANELKEHMKGHFEIVRDIQTAIVLGDLDEAKKKAELLAEHQPADAVEAWESHITAMKEAATAIKDTPDLAAAAKLSAKLGGECANCHEALTAIATFEWHEKPAVTKGDVKSHMLMHKWATERLWEGLVGPSQSHWLLGAEALAIEPLHAGEIKPGSEEPEGVAALALKVHELGTKAAKLEDMPEKIEIYGELLGTCSSCHSLARK